MKALLMERKLLRFASARVAGSVAPGRGIVSATTSWPGTNGNDTIGSKYRLAAPSTVARSLPQMPASLGRTCTQPGPGSAKGSTSARRSGP